MATSTSSGNSVEPATARFTKVGTTTDTLTGRGGLALFSRYLRNIGIFEHLERLFGPLRKSAKGIPVSALFHQLFCFLVDGTSRHLVYFDELKADEGYARTVETEPTEMASSHQIKRFFAKFDWGRIWVFRYLLHRLFLWQLKQAEPEVVIFGLDPVVLNNNDARARQGVQPTYKKVKGFQPLQLTWGPFVVDAIFRGGKKQGNAGDVAGKTVRRAVRFVRKHYREDVPIVVALDNGFFDQKLFRLFEELGIGYTCTGNLYDDVVALAEERAPEAWSRYDNGRQEWKYFEFGNRRKSWKKTGWRRTFYTRPHYENDGQRLLPFARPDRVIYTNLGQGGEIDARLEAVGRADLLRPTRIIEVHHGRGRDELVHRALKDFRAEQLPFKRFKANAAFYYTVMVAFFLYETFKRDVSDEVLPATSYPTRFRRQVLDFAAKIVRTSGETILRVTEATWKRLRIGELWDRTADPPRFAWA